MNTDGQQIADARKRLEHEWMRSRQRMFEAERRRPLRQHIPGPSCWCVSRATGESLFGNEHFAR